jgi:hypothetical protein
MIWLLNTVNKLKSHGGSTIISVLTRSIESDLGNDQIDDM